MKNGILVAALILAAGWGVPRLAADDAPAASSATATDQTASSGDQTFPFDSGPDSIDVSTYPKTQQDNYAVFAEKCSKCHTLARPINSPFALPEEWSAYVSKMRDKKRSGIDEDSAKAITAFLIYDSSVRKKDLIAQKLKEKAAGEKKDTEVKDSTASAKGDSPAKPSDAPPAQP